MHVTHSRIGNVKHRKPQLSPRHCDHFNSIVDDCTIIWQYYIILIIIGNR